MAGADRTADQHRAGAAGGARSRSVASPASRSWAAARFGNRTAAAEFNIWADPEAAAIVFDYGGPLIDGRPRPDAPAPGHRRADRAPSGHVRTAWPRCSPTCSCSSAHTYVVPPRAPARRAGARSVRGARAHPPDLFTSRLAHVVVETAGTLTRGMTLIDRSGRSWSGRRRTAECSRRSTPTPASSSSSSAVRHGRAADRTLAYAPADASRSDARLGAPRRRHPRPGPRTGQVLTKVLACGICGSDLHLLHHGAEQLRARATSSTTAARPIPLGPVAFEPGARRRHGPRVLLRGRRARAGVRQPGRRRRRRRRCPSPSTPPASTRSASPTATPAATPS